MASPSFLLLLTFAYPGVYPMGTTIYKPGEVQKSKPALPVTLEALVAIAVFGSVDPE